MKIFKNIPSAIKVYSHLKYLNKFKPSIEKARISEDKVIEREFILKATSTWGKALSENAGMKLEIFGKENLPTQADGPVVFMANHQGYADIVAMCAVIDTIQFGFVARDNLGKVPLYGKWIDRIRSVMINRNNAREGLKAINNAISLIKEGYSMFIFPEGTRSQSPNIGDFKAGAMKVAVKPQVPIVPISLDGTWKIFEEKGFLSKGNVKVMIHPMVMTKDISKDEEKKLHIKIQKIISNGLEVLRSK